MSKAYYNEIDPYAAAWLRNLMAAGHIAPGVVDERSITEVKPGDLHGYTQCHFFAGIGVWSYALRQAGWPDERPVWTGSCPCQPFSGAGRHKGFKDERHLWPAWFELIQELRPDVLVGEQVAAPAALDWFDAVQADLEAEGYACGATDLCAAGVGAPHIRQRLYWMADAGRQRHELRGKSGKLEVPGRFTQRQDVDQEGRVNSIRQWQRGRNADCDSVPTGRLADSAGQRANLFRASQPGGHGPQERVSGQDGEAGRLGDPGRQGLSGRQRPELCGARRGQEGRAAGQPSGAPGACKVFWGDAEWLFCRDGKWRPAEPGTFPLAHGAPARVGRLRAYGNALCAETAIAFARACLEELS